MLRALQRMMKRSGVLVGLFALLSVASLFPHLVSCQEHSAFAVHHHAPGETLAIGHDLDHTGGSDHAVVGDNCGGDCCAPACCALLDSANFESAPMTIEIGRLSAFSDRYADGSVPVAIERPPRA